MVLGTRVKPAKRAGIQDTLKRSLQILASILVPVSPLAKSLVLRLRRIIWSNGYS